MKILYKVIKISFFLLLVGLFLFWFLLIGFKSDHKGQFFNKNKNAVWLAHSWVGNEKGEEEIQSLVKQLLGANIRYVYVHSGPIDINGGVPISRYPFAEKFLETARKYDENNEIQYLAWLGQLKRHLKYEEEDIRTKLATMSRYLSYKVGFDGVHFDIEPIFDNDKDFLKLLRESRDKIGKQKILSVAVDEWQPKMLTSILNYITKAHSKSYVSSSYLKDLSEICDQIVIMTYDTGLKNPRSYQWLVEQQIIYVSKAVKKSEILIGIPSYDEDKEHFHPIAENIESGLKGVIDGLNNLRSNKESFAGVAIYPHWKTDEKEWEIYKQLWQKNESI